MRLEFVDSHTCGEPTRLILRGWDTPQHLSPAETREWMRREADHVRKGVCSEPRGNPELVGALLLPGDPPGLIFFNNVGYLGMCGHGLMGVVESLHHIGNGASPHRFETPSGVVSAERAKDGTITIQNVAARQYRAGAEVQTEFGTVRGDIAYGGNWFFIVDADTLHCPALTWENRHELTQFTRNLRHMIHSQEIAGENGAEIDHIELVRKVGSNGVDYENFVLCPGGEFDRSPCGTGTSAKLACSLSQGQIQERQWITVRGISGECFRGMVERTDSGLRPTLQGRAHVTSFGTLELQESDPFRWGIL